MSRPNVTMLMLQSVDGKISTGEDRTGDIESYLRMLDAGKGLNQYYDELSRSDYFFMITGKSVRKGLPYADYDSFTAATCVVLDNNWLTCEEISKLCSRYKDVIIFTSNKRDIICGNLHWVDNSRMSLGDMLHHLYTVFNCEQLSLQGGGELNGAMIREGYVDHLRLVVAPTLIGGKDEVNLIGNGKMPGVDEIGKIPQIQLESVTPLAHNYLLLYYNVYYGNGNYIQMMSCDED